MFLDGMKISKIKRDKISEQILAFLFSQTPKAEFTSHIASEIARDEEFVKQLLLELKRKGLVTSISKSPEGKTYSKRLRWKLSDGTYKIYKSRQLSYILKNIKPFIALNTFKINLLKWIR